MLIVQKIQIFVFFFAIFVEFFTGAGAYELGSRKTISPFLSTKGMHCMIHNIATGLPHQWVVVALGKCGKNTASPWRNLNHLSKKRNAIAMISRTRRHAKNQ
jgi:hypothetical protein